MSILTIDLKSILSNKKFAKITRARYWTVDTLP